MITQAYERVPELRGRMWGRDDLRYRLWTSDHGLDFDAVPDYADGGPALVTTTDWVVSNTEINRWLHGVPSAVVTDEEITLNVHRRDDDGQVVPHPLYDGQKFPTARDAKRTAYAAGLLGFQVYERDAARWGLPNAETPVHWLLPREPGGETYGPYPTEMAAITAMVEHGLVNATHRMETRGVDER